MEAEVLSKIKELSDVKRQLGKLNERKRELEAFFLERGGADVTDTKYKSATYADLDSQASVTYTEAQSLSVDSPNYLKETLGKVFMDIFEEKINISVSPANKSIERMLVGIYTGDYVQMFPTDVIKQLPCSDKQKDALLRKLKGISFETDRDYLIKIGGFSEAEAGDYAYLYAEAVVWQTFCRIAEMADVDKEKLMHEINLGISVNSSTKIAVT
ncbi:MAG: hypothetical protein IJZ95_07365 [Oscillospiraceae bacterium]|nr:hypothetical protein [Oscillospiraceae bacterium]